MPELADSEIYIDGDLANRRLDATSRMHYDNDAGVYRHAMLLKQGSYNYQYVVVPRGQSSGLTAPVEGNLPRLPTNTESTYTTVRRALATTVCSEAVP